MEEFNKITSMNHTAVRTKVTGSVLDNPAGQEYLWEISTTDTYPRICLGVLQEDVITGLELLDQIVFKQKGIRLRVHDRIFRTCNLRHHYSCLASQALCWDKILRNSLMQILGLTHIYNSPLGIIISIDTGGMWKQCYFFSDSHIGDPALRSG